LEGEGHGFYGGKSAIAGLLIHVPQQLHTAPPRKKWHRQRVADWKIRLFPGGWGSASRMFLPSASWGCFPRPGKGGPRRAFLNGRPTLFRRVLRKGQNQPKPRAGPRRSWASSLRWVHRGLAGRMVSEKGAERKKQRRRCRCAVHTGGRFSINLLKGRPDRLTEEAVLPGSCSGWRNNVRGAMSRG